MKCGASVMPAEMASGIQKKETERRKEFFIPVIVDNDANLFYEKHCWFTDILIRIPVVLFFNLLPTFLARFLFDTLGTNRGGTKTVSRNASRYQAIEAVYSYPERKKIGQIGFLDSCWAVFLNNSLALRNRLKLVKRELKTAINEVKRRKTDVRLMSLGSGSARAVIEVLIRLNGCSPLVKTILVDRDKEAIDFSKNFARINGVNHIKWHRGYAQNLGKYCGNDFTPDIVEMVGLLDYYPCQEAVKLIRRIYENLAPDGWLITCNIRSNLEQPFLAKGVNWPPLIYRSSKELAEILIEAGFFPEDIKIIYEPLKIHGLAIARKK